MGKLRTSCAQFRTEIGTQLNSLKDVQWEIVCGVGNMAKTVEYKLTENEEGDNKQAQVLTSMYTGVRKIIHELGQNREETKQTNKGIVAMEQKLMRLEENIRNEVRTSAITLIQNQTEKQPKTQKESSVRACRPEMPYLGEVK